MRAFSAASASWCNRILLQHNLFTLFSLSSLLPTEDRNHFLLQNSSMCNITFFERIVMTMAKFFQYTGVLSLCTSYKGVRLYINTDAPWTIKKTTDKLRTGNCLKHLLIFILLACALWAQLQRKLNKSSNILFLSVKDVQFLFPNVYVSSVSLSNTATVQSAYSLFLLPRTALQTDTEAPEKPTQDWEKQEAFKNPY